MSLEEAESFTSDHVTSAIKSCRSSRSYADSLNIFHLKNLGLLATEYLTSLYNDCLKSCRRPSIWKTSLVIPIPKPGKDSSQGTPYRPISLLCPAAKVIEALILPSINEFPKILGVIMDSSISFHNYVSDRMDKRNNMLKALAGSSWGQDKETLLRTYNALEKSISSYAAPVWSTNASDSSFKKTQTVQNAALRTATGAHKMVSIDHLHQESLTLRVKDHSDVLSA